MGHIWSPRRSPSLFYRRRRIRLLGDKLLHHKREQSDECDIIGRRMNRPARSVSCPRGQDCCLKMTSLARVHPTKNSIPLRWNCEGRPGDSSRKPKWFLSYALMALVTIAVQLPISECLNATNAAAAISSGELAQRPFESLFNKVSSKSMADPANREDTKTKESALDATGQLAVAGSSTNALVVGSNGSPSSQLLETQLTAPAATSLNADHMIAADSKKKKKKMKMMKKKKKMEKKHKEWKKGKKHKKKKYESKKKKGGMSKKKKGKKEKKKWGMEKKGHKKKGKFKKKKWGLKKKSKKGQKKGKKGHKMLKDKGHKKKGFKKIYHKEEWGKKKKWHDIKREKKWNTKKKKWKKTWKQEKGKKYKGKHMKKYHKKNKHGKKYKKEKKSKYKKHKGEKFKKGHKKKKEEYSKKKEGGKKKKMKKMKKEMKKKKKG